MDTAIQNSILAIVTFAPDKVGGTGPIFYVKDQKELQETAFTLEKILDGTAHQLKQDIMIVVRH